MITVANINNSHTGVAVRLITVSHRRSGPSHACFPDQLRGKVSEVRGALVAKDHRTNERLPFHAREVPRRVCVARS